MPGLSASRFVVIQSCVVTMLSIDAWLDEKPYKELYDGVVHEKVSPQFDHGQIQIRLGSLLDEWARDRGAVASEWRVYLAEGTTLVPDIAFVTRARLAGLSEDERQKPPFAPDIAIEIRSPKDHERNIRRKTELYLAHGAKLVLDVDPTNRTVRLNDGASEVGLKPGDTLEHPDFPSLRIPVSEIFEPLDRKF